MMNIRMFIYLLPYVSADYCGHHQVVWQLQKKEVEACPLQTMSIKYL